jgi:hypothetical protein
MKTKFLWIAFVASAAMIAQAKADVTKTSRDEKCSRFLMLPLCSPLRINGCNPA